MDWDPWGSDNHYERPASPWLTGALVLAFAVALFGLAAWAVETWPGTFGR